MKTKNTKKNTKKTNSFSHSDVIKYIEKVLFIPKEEINDSTPMELNHLKLCGDFLLEISELKNLEVVEKLLKQKLELIENRILTFK